MRRCVVVNDDERIILDKEDGMTRCAHYRRKKPGENVGGINRELWRRLRGAGFLPESRPEDWIRTGSKAPTLDSAVRNVLQDGNSRGDTDTILLYIQQMDWGW